MMNKDYFELIGARDAEGTYCSVARFTPYEGSSHPAMHFTSGQKLDLHFMDDVNYPRQKMEYVSYVNKNTVIAFSDVSTNEAWALTNLRQPSDIDVFFEYEPDNDDDVTKWQILEADDLLVMFTCQ